MYAFISNFDDVSFELQINKPKVEEIAFGAAPVFWKTSDSKHFQK